MIRNLKVLLAGALALTALGAIAASAHAADEFNCSVTPCVGTLRPDGTPNTKQSHHVFIVDGLTSGSVSFTCESLSGEGSIASSPVKEVTATNLKYNNCTANGSAGVVVDMNGCTYKFFAAGGRTDEAEVEVICPTGKKIEITYNGCVMDISGGFKSRGIGYTTIGSQANKNREITVTTNVDIPSATIQATGTQAQCLINPSQSFTGTYTTGNTIVTGETTAGVMAEAWYE